MDEKDVPKLNLARLVEDLGGPAEASRITGKWRTQPYDWVRRGSVNSRILCAIKGARPDIDLDIYFEDQT